METVLANFNDTNPAAPAGRQNVQWQRNGDNISASVPTAGGGGAAVADLSGQPTAAFGQLAKNGSATTAAKSDHCHAMPSWPWLTGVTAMKAGWINSGDVFDTSEIDGPSSIIFIYYFYSSNDEFIENGIIWLAGGQVVANMNIPNGGWASPGPGHKFFYVYFKFSILGA